MYRSRLQHDAVVILVQHAILEDVQRAILRLAERVDGGEAARDALACVLGGKLVQISTALLKRVSDVRIGPGAP